MTMKFILYCRKSTDTDDKQALSLDSQEHELKELALKDGLEIVETLKESKSAKAPGRPIFNKMLKMIEQGKADAILCWKIDRLCRNPVDGGTIQWMLQNGVIQKIRTFEKTYLPTDNAIIMSVEQGQSSQFITDLRSNVLRGNRAKLENGHWPSRAPFGYLNDKGNKTIILNPNIAPYISRIFELYSTGAYTVEQITNVMHAEGLRTKTGNRVYKSRIYVVLRDSFYFGLMQRDGKLYPGYHPTLITKSLFDKAQAVLDGNLHPKPKTHFYSARGFLTCEKCGCMITAETQKGHAYYHCTGGKGGCEEKKNYIRGEDVDVLLANLFQKLRIDEEWIEISGIAYKDKYQSAFTYTQTMLDTLHNELKALTERESSLVDGYVSKLIAEDMYKVKKLDIENKRVLVNKQIADIQERTGGNAITFERIKEVFTDGNRATESYLEANEVKRRTMLGKLLSNASIKDGNVANFKFKSPYSLIANAEKKDDILVLCAMQDSNLPPSQRQ